MKSKGLNSKIREIAQRRSKKYYQEFKNLKINEKVRINSDYRYPGKPHRRFENKIGIVIKKLNKTNSEVQIKFKKKFKKISINNIHIDKI